MLSAGFNYWVDPYGLFGTNRLTGFNELKPATSERVRVIKPYMASRLKPRTVIGGNSRPEVGIDPQSSCWKKSEQPIFNTGIPGAGVFMQVRYIQHAVESGDAQLVLLGLDFLDFLIDSSKPVQEIDWNHLGESFDGRLRSLQTGRNLPITFQKFKDIFNGLFSLVTLQDSIITIISQKNKHSATRREDGFNPGFDYQPIIHSEGQSVLFQQKNQEVSIRLRHDKLDVFDTSGQISVPFEALKRFLSWSKNRRLNVILFINPYHSDYLTLIKISGKWPIFEEWKRQITSIADKYAIPLWDFNTIDQYSTESPPLPGNKNSQLQWYWEPAHYRRELGDLMLASMLNRDCNAAQSNFRLGSKITIPILQAHLNSLASDLQRFIDENPQVVNRIMNNINSKNQGTP
jgi:hypothetical protein